MKRLLLLMVLTTLTGEIFSQNFQLGQSIILPDSIAEARSEWVDLDNDGVLDILLITKNSIGKSYLMVIKGDTINPLALSAKSKAIFTDEAYAVVDYNHDNQMDILISGTSNSISKTVLYINQGDFNFEELILDVPPFQTIKFADLDNDAKVEWILSGEENNTLYTYILKERNPGSWEVVHDSLKIKLTALEVLDVDRNGELDLFISGMINPDSLFTGFLINKGNFYLTPAHKNPWMGTTSLSDISNDDLLDITFTGQDKSGNTISRLFVSNAGGYDIQNSTPALKEVQQFVADLNSDGLVDFSFLGKDNSDNTINVIQYTNGSETLPHKEVITQRFGDLEHDGDLDLIQVIKNDKLTVTFIRNENATENNFPDSPFNAVALPVFNRLFMYWEKPADDHTPVESITYDVYLENASLVLQNGEFDLVNERRLTASHGNNGTQNFKLLKNLAGVNINYSIQSVDNALHGGSLCIGSGQHCASVETERISLCSNEKAKLTSPVAVEWFSFASGYLGNRTSFDLTVNKSDTIFHYDPHAPGCSSLKAWTIEINNDTVKTETIDLYACIETEIQLEVEEGWEQINWKSILRGDLGSSPSITYKVTAPDSILVTLSNPEGCTILRKTALKLSSPVVTVTEDNYKLLKGQSVQLSAAGAEEYVWSPSTGLNHTNIANPVATPSQNIQYTVTGFDSLGCQGNAIVTILVESMAFVPTLFTPNNDGKNDELKIFGLTTASDFSFSVFNREGSVVFKTHNVSEAIQKGWDGTTNGVRQPNGVYFWKVNGIIASGNKLLLNGKESGSIVLVR